VGNGLSTKTKSRRIALLFFDTPRGLRLNVSSLASQNFASSYTLGSVGLVDGSLSYLYSSLAVHERSRSGDLSLRNIVQGYRFLQELRKPESKLVTNPKAPHNRKPTLLYGRLYLPQSTLEALYLRRLSPTKQFKLSCVSDSALHRGGALLALLQQDNGKFSTEYLYSTDSALLGLRGLYNFGPDPRNPSGPDDPPDQLYGRFSAGAELYYGLLNKSGGMSTGIRFTTLPKHAGFPYTMTLTLNPLMGNLSSTYAVKAGRNIALCSQFDFNFYSYESDLRLGCELWRRRPRLQQSVVVVGGGQENGGGEVALAQDEAALRGNSSSIFRRDDADNDVSGVLKARWDQNWRIGLLWEGRIKELLFSLGASFDLQRRQQIFQAVGLELQYSS